MHPYLDDILPSLPDEVSARWLALVQHCDRLAEQGVTALLFRNGGAIHVGQMIDVCLAFLKPQPAQTFTLPPEPAPEPPPPLTGEWLGEVGNRVRLHVTLVQHIDEGHDYPSVLHVWRDYLGREFTWYAPAGRYLGSPGERIVIVGTVKNLTSYNGVKQTRLVGVKEA